MPADAPATEGRRVFIAGAGIAGASAAFHLGQAGFAVTICDPAGPASGASGNPAGLVLPRLDLDESPAAHFYRQAWLYTTALIVELEAGADEPILRSEGGLLLAKTAQDADRHRRLAETFKGAPELVTRSGPVAGGFAECAASPDAHLLVQRGGTIDPAAFVRALLQGTRIINAPFTGFATKENSIEVTLAGQDGPVIHETDYLVIATALAAREHLPGHGLAGSLGQVDVIDAAPPPRAVTFGNYAAPLGAHTITGATYENYDELKPAAPSPERTRQNIAALRAMAPHVPATSDIISSRTAIRAVTPDRHPVAGPMPDPAHIQAAYAGLRQGRREEYPTARYLPGVYILTGLGSRGLTTAPYCAAIVSAEISGAPSPAQRDILDLVHPARFMIRDLKRRKAGTGP